MKLIVNADDFGLTDNVTYGILTAMERGIVTSTTMMVNTPGTQCAAMISRVNPNLAVGLHINISLGNPLTECPSLTENGSFLKPAVIGNDDRYEETDLYQEMLAQYHRFIELTGRKPTHLDSHLYVHQKFPKVSRMMRKLADEMQLPVRDMETALFPRIHFEGEFKVKPGETQTDLKEKCLKIISNLSEYSVAELMVHPSLPDEWLNSHSSYHLQRTMELAVLTDPEVYQSISSAAISLATFRDLE